LVRYLQRAFEDLTLTGGRKKNFAQKMKFSFKSEILVKKVIYVKTQNFRQKSKFWLKIGNLVKNLNFGQKSKCWSKI